MQHVLAVVVVLAIGLLTLAALTAWTLVWAVWALGLATAWGWTQLWRPPPVQTPARAPRYAITVVRAPSPAWKRASGRVTMVRNPHVASVH